VLSRLILPSLVTTSSQLSFLISIVLTFPECYIQLELCNIKPFKFDALFSNILLRFFHVSSRTADSFICRADILLCGRTTVYLWRTSLGCFYFLAIMYKAVNISTPVFVLKNFQFICLIAWSMIAGLYSKNMCSFIRNYKSVFKWLYYFVFLSPMNKTFPASFQMFICHLCIFFGEVSFKVFSHFKLGCSFLIVKL
jgi:hypothetical protein